MSTIATVSERPETPHENGMAQNGQPLAEWLRDPQDAWSRPRGPYTLATADEYLDQEAVELYNGWLVWQEMTDIKERTVVGTIQDMLSMSARKAGFGQVLPDQAECLLQNGDVIKPDLCLISWARLARAGTPQGPNQRILLTECPELVIESRSPSNRRRQEARKRAQYFAHWTAIVWDVDEVNEVIYVYQASAPLQPVRYGIGDAIDCPLLPGWRRQVADIFAMQVSAEAVAGEVATAWRHEGIEVGEARGIEIGKEQGIEIGEARGLQAAIELGLDLKFGETLPAIHQVLNLDVLRALYAGIKTAQSMAEFSALYAGLVRDLPA